MRTEEQKAKAKAYMTEWRARNRDKLKGYWEARKKDGRGVLAAKKYRDTHVEVLKGRRATHGHQTRSKKWKEEHPEQRRSHELKSKYGITIEQYFEILGRQGGGCAICGKLPDGKNLHV